MNSLAINLRSFHRAEDEGGGTPPELIGAVIGAGGGAVLSLLLSESETGVSAVNPLFVLTGVLVGIGIASAF